MKKRSLGKMFLLEIVTLGIYRLYYLIKTRKEMMTLNPNVKIKSPAFLIVPVVIIVIGFTLAIAGGFYNASSRLKCEQKYHTNTLADTSKINNTISPNCVNAGANIASLLSGVVAYLTIFVAMILFIVWEWSYSHGVAIITGEKLGFAVALIILILVPDGIDILIIQDYFNKLNAAVAPHPYSAATMALPNAMSSSPVDVSINPVTSVSAAPTEPSSSPTFQPIDSSPIIEQTVVPSIQSDTTPPSTPVKE